MAALAGGRKASQERCPLDRWRAWLCDRQEDPPGGLFQGLVRWGRCGSVAAGPDAVTCSQSTRAAETRCGRKSPGEVSGGPCGGGRRLRRLRTLSSALPPCPFELPLFIPMWGLSLRRGQQQMLGVRDPPQTPPKRVSSGRRGIVSRGHYFFILFQQLNLFPSGCLSVGSYPLPASPPPGRRTRRQPPVTGGSQLVNCQQFKGLVLKVQGNH